MASEWMPLFYPETTLLPYYYDVTEINISSYLIETIKTWNGRQLPSLFDWLNLLQKITPSVQGFF